MEIRTVCAGFFKITFATDTVEGLLTSYATLLYIAENSFNRIRNTYDSKRVKHDKFKKRRETTLKTAHCPGVIPWALCCRYVTFTGVQFP